MDTRMVSKTFEKGFAEMRDFHAVLGELGFAVSALDCLRFFTAPLFACAAAVPRGAYLGPAFMAEAKAEGQHVCVGGWECLGGCPPGQARWFSLELTRDSAPWATGRGEPFKAIAALELFTLLLWLMIFSPRWKKQLRRVGGHQWFHGQCGKRGGAGQTDDIEESWLSG